MQDKWMDLFLGSAEDRKNINERNVEIETQNRIENLVKATIALNHIFNVNAQLIADDFAAARAAAKFNKNQRDQKTSFRLRVRMTDSHTLSAEWYKTNSSFGRIKFDNKNRNRSYYYSARTFYGQSDWVQDFARQAEAKLGLLRKQNDILHIIRKYLYELSASVADYHRLVAGNTSNESARAQINTMLGSYFVNGEQTVAENAESTFEDEDLTVEKEDSMKGENSASDKKKKVAKLPPRNTKDEHFSRRVTGAKMKELLKKNYPQLNSQRDEE